MIRPNEVIKAMNKFDSIIDKGGEVIAYPHISGPNMTIMSPGIIRVDKCKLLEDEEIFGPIIQVKTYDTFEEGITLANDTKFGLAAGLVSKDATKFKEFYNRVDAGILNWNQQLTGATKFAPFGGIKNSGNFRPAGYLSADYCSYATASFEVNQDDMKISSIPGLNI
jgi:succinylglutamic semialdehyde dehydrogenase